MAGHTPRQGPPRKGAPKKPNFAARRILALLIVAALAALIVWAGVSIYRFVGQSIEANAAAPEIVPTDAPFTGQPTACDAEVVDWVFAAQPGNAGERVPFQVTITNGGEIPCLVDAGAASLVFEVTSGDDEIWSNAHCSSDEHRLLLGAGDSTEQAVIWSGGRSAPGCAAVEATPEPGTYKVTVTYNGVEVPEGTMVFDLR